MLIPGLPVVGAQQDATKPKRGVQPAVESAPVQEPLVEVQERRQRDQKRTPDRRRGRRRRIQAEERNLAEQPPGELPSVGLLVDIEV